MGQKEERPGGQAGELDGICVSRSNGDCTAHLPRRKASFRLGPLSRRGEKWALVVNGGVIVLTTMQLIAGPSGRAFRGKALEQLDILPPSIPRAQWQEIVRALLVKMRGKTR